MPQSTTKGTEWRRAAMATVCMPAGAMMPPLASSACAVATTWRWQMVDSQGQWGGRRGGRWFAAGRCTRGSQDAARASAAAAPAGQPTLGASAARSRGHGAAHPPCHPASLLGAEQRVNPANKSPPTPATPAPPC